MSAGEFRDKLIVQSFVVEVNDSNEGIETWSTQCEPWGRVEPLGGTEHSLVIAQQNLAEVLYQIDLRADPATTMISPKMRVIWTDPGGVSVLLYVSAVLKSPHRDIVRLLAQERK